MEAERKEEVAEVREEIRRGSRRRIRSTKLTLSPWEQEVRGVEGWLPAAPLREAAVVAEEEQQGAAVAMSLRPVQRRLRFDCPVSVSGR